MNTLFDVFTFEDTTSSKKKILIEEFPVINKKDWEPVSLIQPDLHKGPFIAGGAPLRWFVGQNCGESDIDVFCVNVKQADTIVKRIQDHGRYQVMAKTENAITMRYYSQEPGDQTWLIQVIYVRFFPTLEQVIDSFDISVCQIGTTGYEWKLGKNTAKDLRKKQFRFESELRTDSMKRLVKYWTYGFTPIDGTLDTFETSDIKWDLVEHEPYQNAF